MFSFISNLFGPKVDLNQLVADGAVIVDVRTKGEYQQGHVKGAINIPLGNLPSQYQRLRKDKPVITCCASGMRSGQAKSFLKSQGYAEVHNGGGWMSLERKISNR
ncbi:MAG: rhodanese-like domain-containing protein [Cyclobacteriaceae bacterium]|nr:rhodanese-like domain-containing protein [Cyclobacteriaceae bacterium]